MTLTHTAATTALMAQRLLSRSAASAARVVRVPGFFDDEDVAVVATLREEHHAHRGGPPRPARRNWTTTYLSAGGLFRERAPDLYARLRDLRHHVDLTPFVEHGDDQAAAQALLDSLTVRCVELHEGGEGGSLHDPKHYDDGSVVTVDVLLHDEFEGGHFSTLEDGKVHRHADFTRGDALVFPSYKYHSVAPITNGRRATLVVEFWRESEEHRGNDRGGAVLPVRHDDTDNDAIEVVTVRFSDPLPLGVVFGFEDAARPDNQDEAQVRDGRPVTVRVTGVRPGTQAARKRRLSVDSSLVLTHVNARSVVGLGFCDVDAIIANAIQNERVRPVVLRFERRPKV